MKDTTTKTAGGFLARMILLLLGGSGLSLAVGMIHDYWIPAVPKLGFWTGVGLVGAGWVVAAAVSPFASQD